VPAAFLIEKAGWKGKKIGNVGVSEKHSLILINYGKARGDEMLSFSRDIINSVEEKFGIILEPEVIIW
jgi:UDP-N-acetylmuramate dehydrogenase